jgi:hypothetical protein
MRRNIGLKDAGIMIYCLLIKLILISLGIFRDFPPAISDNVRTPTNEFKLIKA